MTKKEGLWDDVFEDFGVVNGMLTRPLGLLDYQTHYFNVDEYYGDWRLDGKEYVINIHDLMPVLNDCETVADVLHKVDLNDIAWKGFDHDKSTLGDNCGCCGGYRFRDCDTTVPGILLKGTQNPGGKYYRCLDGKHRIYALMSYKMQYGNFYVLNMSDIEKYLIPL